MDGKSVERVIPEVEMTKMEALDEKVKRAISSLERVKELNERSTKILDRRIDWLKNPTPNCEGICPMCGQVWDA